MKKYCVRFYNTYDIKVSEDEVLAESPLTAVFYSLEPFVTNQIPELQDVETFSEAAEILERRGGLITEVFRIL